jgi:peroxiredoxin
MKNLFLFIIITFILLNHVFGQGAIPAVNVKKLDATVVSTATFDNGTNPIIIVFWETSSASCKKLLNEINEDYPDWQKETGVKLIAISVDDARNSSKVKPYVDAKAWEYEVYLDENQDFKRAMNITTLPYLIVLNAQKEIVYTKNNYIDGDKAAIYEEVKKVKGN